MKALNKLDPFFVSGLLNAVTAEPKGVRGMYHGAKCSMRTAHEYTKVMAHRGLLKPEVGEGENGQYIIAYRITDAGKQFIPKLNEVMEFLNPKDG